MSTRIFVGRLPWFVSKEQLRSHFAQFGAVKETSLVLDRRTGKSKGFAFLDFDTEETQQAVLAQKEHLFEVRSKLWS
jgi:RNA recognition motif-containing protein